MTVSAVFGVLTEQRNAVGTLVTIVDRRDPLRKNGSLRLSWVYGWNPGSWHSYILYYETRWERTSVLVDLLAKASDLLTLKEGADPGWAGEWGRKDVHAPPG
jgi:hypothetical protein